MVPPLEDEYTMLKKLVADLSLDKAMLQETLKPSRKHTLVDPLRTDWKVSIRRACSTLRIDRAKYVYKSKRDGIAPAETGGVRLFQGGALDRLLRSPGRQQSDSGHPERHLRMRQDVQRDMQRQWLYRAKLSLLIRAVSISTKR